jgi:hypothetical protein
MRARTALPLLVVFASSLVTGCVYHQHRGDGGPPVRVQGPPPHAPAHGYRARYQDHDFVFDSHLAVYVVLGFPEVFWCDGWYHRRSGYRWQRADRFEGPWHDSRWDDIPPRLRGDGKGKGPGQGQGKGPGQGKGKDKGR